MEAGSRSLSCGKGAAPLSQGFIAHPWKFEELESRTKDFGTTMPGQRSVFFFSPNTFLRCVRPFCHCWCPPFSAGHAAFLFICLPCNVFPSVSHTSHHCPVRLTSTSDLGPHTSHRLSWLSSTTCPSTQPSMSGVDLLRRAVYAFCLPLCPVLSPFLLVTVSALSPFCLLLSGHYHQHEEKQQSRQEGRQGGHKEGRQDGHSDQQEGGLVSLRRIARQRWIQQLREM